jgi:cellobiose-specific phosphotransferase system component IIC
MTIIIVGSIILLLVYFFIKNWSRILFFLSEGLLVHLIYKDMDTLGIVLPKSIDRENMRSSAQDELWNTTKSLSKSLTTGEAAIPHIVRIVSTSLFLTALENVPDSELEKIKEEIENETWNP